MEKFLSREERQRELYRLEKKIINMLINEGCYTPKVKLLLDSYFDSLFCHNFDVAFSFKCELDGYTRCLVDFNLIDIGVIRLVNEILLDVQCLY